MSAFHVFTRQGDATADVESALAALKEQGIGKDACGMYKCMYVTRADQTVLMVESADSPLAREMRGRRGWTEPGDRPLN